MFLLRIGGQTGGERQHRDSQLPASQHRPGMFQRFARRYLEPTLEPVFHPDSHGHRPGKSAIDAVRAARERCWRYDWVLDLDLKSFFDSIDWELMRGDPSPYGLSVGAACQSAWKKRPGSARKKDPSVALDQACPGSVVPVSGLE
jgi:hypothetical protein